MQKIIKYASAKVSKTGSKTVKNKLQKRQKKLQKRAKTGQTVCRDLRQKCRQQPLIRRGLHSFGWEWSYLPRERNSTGNASIVYLTRPLLPVSLAFVRAPERFGRGINSHITFMCWKIMHFSVVYAPLAKIRSRIVLLGVL